MKKTSNATVETSRGRNNGTWVLRDSRAGRVIEIRTTKRSQEIIKESASANKPLLDRLAKR